VRIIEARQWDGQEADRLPMRALRQENPVRQDIGTDIGEYACYRLGEVQGSRGRTHRAAHANRQWIAEQIAKPAQRMTHRGLHDPDMSGAPLTLPSMIRASSATSRFKSNAFTSTVSIDSMQSIDLSSRAYRLYW